MFLIGYAAVPWPLQFTVLLSDSKANLMPERDEAADVLSVLLMGVVWNEYGQPWYCQCAYSCGERLPSTYP